MAACVGDDEVGQESGRLGKGRRCVSTRRHRHRHRDWDGNGNREEKQKGDTDRERRTRARVREEGVDSLEERNKSNRRGDGRSDNMDVFSDTTC